MNIHSIRITGGTFVSHFERTLAEVLRTVSGEAAKPTDDLIDYHQRVHPFKDSFDYERERVAENNAAFQIPVTIRHVHMISP